MRTLIIIFILSLFAVGSFAQVDPSAITDQNQAVSDTVASSGVDDSIKEEMPQLKELISFGKVFWTAIFLLVGYFVIRFLGGILGRFAERSTTYRITIKGLVPVVKISGCELKEFNTEITPSSTRPSDKADSNFCIAFDLY